MSASIKQLVDRGVELRRQIKGLKKELDAIEDQLSNAALWKDHEALADPDRDGRRYMAHGSALVVPVIFTADKIVGSFKDDSPVHERIALASASRYMHFFSREVVYDNKFADGKKFRTEAYALLAERASSFIDACLARDKHGIPKSDIKIAWDDAKEAQ